MSLLAVGLSHNSAPVALLERCALDEDTARKLLQDLAGADNVQEALVLSTCNRVEVHADVAKFHGGLQEISELLARAAGVALDELTGHLYVHYEDRAVQHLFTVACGLDSMVVGETQILGQLRRAFHTGRQEGTVGRTLDPLAQQALRVGKRVHAETGIDRAGQSLVGVGLRMAAEQLGGLAGRSAVIVGAGSMSALAATSLHRERVADITVVNRTPTNARRLAAAVSGRAAALGELPALLGDADLVVSCTGATGTVIDAAMVADARPHARTAVFLDIALPRDVDPAVRTVPGCTVVDLEMLAAAIADQPAGQDVAAARTIVSQEVRSFLSMQRTARVAPTVAALRGKADDVVARELRRLDTRRPDLDPRVRAELEAVVRRVVDKLLHSPTVRVKQLAGSADGDAYATALRELFDLDPSAPAAVARADALADNWTDHP
jgi:glutamyl-tRNA reductase